MSKASRVLPDDIVSAILGRLSANSLLIANSGCRFYFIQLHNVCASRNLVMSTFELILKFIAGKSKSPGRFFIVDYVNESFEVKTCCNGLLIIIAIFKHIAFGEKFSYLSTL